VGGAVYYGVASSKADDPPELSRKGSTALDGAPRDQALPFAPAEPSSYAIRYRTERYDREQVAVASELIEVRRPFDARVTSSQGGRVVSTRISRLGVLAFGTSAGARSFVSPPSPATSDVRLATVLGDAVGEGHAQVRERRRVIGVDCQVYRVGTAVAAGELVPVNTRAGEHADICVDRDGLLLEEVWIKDGRPLQRRVATSRRVDPTFPDERFHLTNEQAVSSAQGNGFFRAIDPSSGFEGTGYRISDVPDGFTSLGRYLVQPPRLSLSQSPVQDERPPEPVSVVDVWARGPDLLVLSQTIDSGQTAIPQRSEAAEPLDLGPTNAAATLLDLRSVEVRIEVPDHRFLRLAGTLRLAQLVDLAKGLRAEVGTGPVPL
jgi:hypothetical protein